MMTITGIGSGNSFQLGPIIIEPSRNLIHQDGTVYSLEPRIMDVLEYLAVHHGKVCSRDEIISAIWNVEFGADESLTRAISVIRKTFRQAGGRGQYIQTISKRGYILQEPPVRLEAPEPAPPVVSKRAKSLPKPAVTLPPASHAENVDVLEDKAPSARPPTRRNFRKMAIASVVASLTIFGGVYWQLQDREEPLGQMMEISEFGRSVAVMPFVDMSVEQDHKYFSDGMAEELVNELGKIDSLRVIGQRFGGANSNRDLSYDEIGGKLRVAHVIDGSVRKQGERVRITARLIDTEDNRRVWSSSYDGTLDNIFDLQQRVSKDIATEFTLLLNLEIEDPIYLEDFLPASASIEIK